VWRLHLPAVAVAFLLQAVPLLSSESAVGLELLLLLLPLLYRIQLEEESLPQQIQGLQQL
jgi:hypothetical protein